MGRQTFVLPQNPNLAKSVTRRNQTTAGPWQCASSGLQMCHSQLGPKDGKKSLATPPYVGIALRDRLDTRTEHQRVNEKRFVSL